MSKKSTHLLIDMDGTLIDSSPGIFKCIHYAFKELGMPLAPKTNLDWCIGPGIHSNMRTLLGPRLEHLTEEAVAHYRVRYKKEGIYEARVYPGILSSLKKLEPHFSLFVATAKPTVFAKQAAKHFKFDHYFDKIFGSNLDGSLAKKSDLITEILNKQKNRHLKSYVMIGDREHDIIGAVTNAIDGFGVAWGYGSQSELMKSGAKKVFKTPAQMVTYFKRQLGE